MTFRSSKPSGTGFLGLKLSRQLSERPLETMTRIGQECGDIGRARIGPYHAFWVIHPELINEVLVKQSKAFRKWPFQIDIFRPIDGEGLVVSSGDFWLRQRRLVQPAFAKTRLTSYSEIIVQYAKRAVQRWKQEQEINVAEEITHLTLEIIAKSLFNLELKSELEELRLAVHELSLILTAEFSRAFRLPDWFPSPEKRRKRAAIKTLRSLIEKVVADWRLKSEDRGDLLSMLLLATDEEGDGARMTDRQVCDEAMTLFNAGHDTTASALTWIILLLSQHPQVKVKVKEEIKTQLQGRAPSFEDCSRLPYLQSVIKETLRLYPPAWALFTRESVAATKLGGFDIPKGSLIFINPWITHRDARFWEDPESFLPERFSGDNETTLPKFAYFPFGGGGHLCIGKGFAMMELTLVIASIYQDIDFELPKDFQLKIEALLSLRPKGSVPMTVST